MALHEFRGITPTIGKDCYIVASAEVIGKVKMGDNVSVWFNAVIRGDVNDIVIGNRSNVQDLALIHVSGPNPAIIGENVTIGHGAMVHGCRIGNNCLIGMGAIVLDGAEIGDNCIVAAGTVVSPGKKFPEGSMILGIPARATRPLTEEERAQCLWYADRYEDVTKMYRP